MTKKFLSFALASILAYGIAFGAESNYTIEGKEQITRNRLTLYVEANSSLKERILSEKKDSYAN